MVYTSLVAAHKTALLKLTGDSFGGLCAEPIHIRMQI